MYQEERLQAIMNFLQLHRRVSVEEICATYQVSRDTARRDLVKLEEKGLIIRTRGGALLAVNHPKIKNYQNRLKFVSEEKKKIGKLAASLIKDNDYVLLDASTTVQTMGDFINQDCTVVTNSINVADILSTSPKTKIRLLGGILHKEHRYLYGDTVLQRLSHFLVDLAFIGTVGISEHGVSIADEEDGAVKQRMIQQAKQVIILADHNKIGVTDFYRFATLKEIDLLITDKEPAKEMVELLKENNVELLVCKEGED